MLLVGDPQILGKTYDSSYYSPLANFDSDRYLAWYYEKAVEHVRPDVICFLGDLMDEGTTANEQHFEEYYERFGQIFPTHPTAKVLLNIKLVVYWGFLRQSVPKWQFFKYPVSLKSSIS